LKVIIVAVGYFAAWPRKRDRRGPIQLERLTRSPDKKTKALKLRNVSLVTMKQFYGKMSQLIGGHIGNVTFLFLPEREQKSVIPRIKNHHSWIANGMK
jgi:hypothetical protein